MIAVDALDSRGRAVPTANDKLAFRVSGAGRLIREGNGDPDSLESDKASKRSLFKGLAQLIVQSNGVPGDIRIDAFARTAGAAAARARKSDRQVAAGSVRGASLSRPAPISAVSAPRNGAR
jgi:beta-galactosidase